MNIILYRAQHEAEHRRAVNAGREALLRLVADMARRRGSMTPTPITVASTIAPPDPYELLEEAAATLIWAGGMIAGLGKEEAGWECRRQANAIRAALKAARREVA